MYVHMHPMVVDKEDCVSIRKGVFVCAGFTECKREPTTT